MGDVTFQLVSRTNDIYPLNVPVESIASGHMSEYTLALDHRQLEPGISAPSSNFILSPRAYLPTTSRALFLVCTVLAWEFGLFLN